MKTIEEIKRYIRNDWEDKLEYEYFRNGFGVRIHGQAFEVSSSGGIKLYRKFSADGKRSHALKILEKIDEDHTFCYELYDVKYIVSGNYKERISKITNIVKSALGLTDLWLF